MSKARELAELSRTVSDSADATAITINSSEEVTFADDIFLADGKKAIFGADSDLQIYHDGLNSYIADNGTGGLTIQANADFLVQSTGSNENMIYGATNAFVKLFYNGVEKLATTSTGIDVTGNLSTITNSNVWTGEFTQSNTSNGDGVFISVGSTAAADYALSVRTNAGAHSGLAVKADGNVGVGTFSPRRQIHLHNAASATTKLMITNGATGESNDGQGFQLGLDSSGNALVENRENTNLTFYTNNSPRMTITNTGNTTFSGSVTVNSGNKLIVNRTDNATGGEITYGPSAGTGFTFNDVNGDGIDFKTGSTMLMSIDSTNQRVSIGTSSAGTFRTKIKHSAASVTTGLGIEASANGSVLRVFHSGSLAGFNATYSGSGAYVPMVFNVGSGGEVMRLGTDGNVGIGTSAPNSNGGGSATVLHIHDPDASNWAVTHYTNGSTGSAGGDGFIAGNIGSDAYLWNYESSPIIFATASLERMRIDAAGAMHLVNGSNSAFIDFDTNSLQLNTQRNPNTGAFVNTGKSHAGIQLFGGSGDSHIRFFTTNQNNAVGTERLKIDKDGIAHFSGSVASNKLSILAADGVRDADYVGSFQNQEATSGRSFGVSIAAGTGGSDIALNVVNGAADTALLRVFGNGVTTIGGDLQVMSGDIQMGSGRGINFTASSNFSGMSSETLSDYEQGTWTPAVTGTGNSFAAGAATGRYTKIGRMVYAQLFINNNPSNTFGSGGYEITGLPFTAVNATPQVIPASVMTRYMTPPSGAWQLSTYVSANQSIMSFYWSDTGNWEQLIGNHITSTTFAMYAGVVYEASS